MANQPHLPAPRWPPMATTAADLSVEADPFSTAGWGAKGVAPPFAATLEKDLRRAIREKPAIDAIERAEIFAGFRPPPSWLDMSNWTSPFDPRLPRNKK